MSAIRIQVDPGKVLDRHFSQIEREQLPFAIVQACNATAYEIRELWKRTAPRVFDRPAPLTRNAALYRKATKSRLYAEIYLRDEAFKGNPPAKYLGPEVEGGQRRKKGFENLLQQKGMMPSGEFAVAGRGAKLDAYGNVPGKTITTILSQLGAQSDRYQNQTPNSIARRRARAPRRGGDYFALTKRRGKLLPGVYERIETGFGSAVRSVLIFTPRATYRKRYDIFGLAERQWEKLMPFYFGRELAKAVQSPRRRS
jgi:hypothetical protein